MRLVVLALLLTRTAYADDTESYRGTVAVLDGVAIGLAIPGIVGIGEADGGTRALAIVATSLGGALWVFGTPIAHYVKQDTKDKYYLSIGARVIVPGLVIGLAANYGSGRCPETDKRCSDLTAGFAIGAVVGSIVVSALDIALLAKRRVIVAPTTGGATVGFAF